MELGSPVPDHTNSNVVLDENALGQVREEAPGIGLTELIETFTAEITLRHQRIAQALRDNDLDRAEYEAHTLSGTSGTFGAMRLQAIAIILERQCHSGDVGGARESAAALTTAWDEACAAFRAYAERNANG
jgi:HPt (histidine-containing phosphotransfer) domain-containing protein